MAEEEKKKIDGEEPKPTNDNGKTDEQIRREARQEFYNDKEGEWGSYSGRYRSVKKETYEDLDTDYTYGGGFYYDSQLEDPFLSVSLHANKKIDKDGNWVKWSEKEEECLEAISENLEWSKCYGAEPIARCIMSEDFSYSIANDFQDVNQGNPIEGAFASLKPHAPILAKYGKNLGEATSDPSLQTGLGSLLVSSLQSIGKKASSIMSGASNYLNRALFVQGSRFTYYNGTQFNFNNMEMKFIVFSDYVRRGNSWKFQSVEDYIKTLQPYVMGIYSKYSADFLKETGFQGNLKEFIKEYVGFQDPPGGFFMDTKNLNNVLEGTLRLNIGGTWAIENLVIKGMNVNMSRVQAKHPENSGETVPLYAEISIQLAPACSTVDTGYRKIIEHKGLGDIRGSIAGSYNQKMSQLINKYNGNK